MPKGDRLRLKADPEDGTTPISNLLLEAVAMAKLSGLQTRAILYLWRKTYGWVDDNGKRKKECEIGLTEWIFALDTSRSRASDALAGLTGKNIIIRNSDNQWGTYTYKINTDIAKWDSGCLNHKALSKLEQLPKTEQLLKQEQLPVSGTIAQNGTVAPSGIEQLPKTEQEQLPKTEHPTLYKEILNKDKEKSDLKIAPVFSEEKLKRGMLVADVFSRIDKIRGYRPPKRGAENKSVLRMVKDYTPDQIVETYQKLKSDTFWENKELYLMSVESQIGAIIHGKVSVKKVAPNGRELIYEKVSHDTP